MTFLCHGSSSQYPAQAQLVTWYSNDGAEFFCELSPITCHGMAPQDAQCGPLELVLPRTRRCRSSTHLQPPDQPLPAGVTAVIGHALRRKRSIPQDLVLGMGRTLWRASPENFPDPCHSGTRYSRHQAHNFFSRMTLSWARRLVVGPDDSPCPTGTSSTNPPAPQHDGSTAQHCAVTRNSSSRNAPALSWLSPVWRDKNVHPHLEPFQKSHHRWVKIAPISHWMGTTSSHTRPCSRAKAGDTRQKRRSTQTVGVIPLARRGT